MKEEKKRGEKRKTAIEGEREKTAPKKTDRQKQTKKQTDRQQNDT